MLSLFGLERVYPGQRGVEGGATGDLKLNQVTGTFANDEAITDSVTGAAVVNGTLVPTETFFVPQGTDLEFFQYFDDDEGLIPNDLNGTPRPLLFTTTTLVGGGWAECEWDYVKLSK